MPSFQSIDPIFPMTIAANCNFTIVYCFRVGLPKTERTIENGNFKFRSPIIRWNSPLQRWRLLFHIAVLYSPCPPDSSRRFSMSKYIPGNQKHLTLDDGSQNESMSISNQKLMLKDYAEKNSMPLKARNTEKFIRGIITTMTILLSYWLSWNRPLTSGLLKSWTSSLT